MLNRGQISPIAALSGVAGPPVRTTLFTWNDFTSGGGFTATGEASVVANNQADPDGGNTADTYTANGASSAHNVKRTMSIVAGAVTGFGIKLKRGTINRVCVREDQQTGKGSVFDLTDGTVKGNLVSAVGSVVADAAGFWICETKFTYISATFAGFRVSLMPDDAVDLNNEIFTSSASLILYDAYVWTE